MKIHNFTFVILLLLGGCALSNSQGIKAGYKDSKEFQSGKEVKPNYGLGYVEGWKKAQDPGYQAELKKREDETAAEAKAAQERAEADKLAEREKIKTLICK